MTWPVWINVRSKRYKGTLVIGLPILDGIMDRVIFQTCMPGRGTQAGPDLQVFMDRPNFYHASLPLSF